jgi:lipopolysaccharide export system permease protein
MKILDRYVLVAFLKNYLISFMVLIGLYIVLDMVFNFDELAEVQSKTHAGGVASMLTMLRAIGDYYFFQTFRIFIHLSGIIPIVAAAFTLIRLTRFNELTAQLAAGVPLVRIAAPIVIAAIVLNGLLILDQEILIPQMIPKLVRKHDEIQQSSHRTFAIRAMQDEQNGLLNAGRYHPETQTSEPWMEQIDVIQFDERFMPVAHISAQRADWDPRGKQWKLTNGRMVTGLRPGETVTKEKAWPAYRSNITPDEVSLYRSGEYVELLPSARITLLLERPKSYGTIDLQRVKHNRFTQPVLNVLLILLAIPWLMSREPGKIKQGIMFCVMLCGACLGTVFLCYQVAGKPPSGAQWADRWPAIMSWTPIFIFGPLAVWLLDRMHRMRT